MLRAAKAWITAPYSATACPAGRPMGQTLSLQAAAPQGALWGSALLSNSLPCRAPNGANDVFASGRPAWRPVGQLPNQQQPGRAAHGAKNVFASGRPAGRLVRLRPTQQQPALQGAPWGKRCLCKRPLRRAPCSATASPAGRPVQQQFALQGALWGKRCLCKGRSANALFSNSPPCRTPNGANVVFASGRPASALLSNIPPCRAPLGANVVFASGRPASALLSNSLPCRAPHGANDVFASGRPAGRPMGQRPTQQQPAL